MSQPRRRRRRRGRGRGGQSGDAARKQQGQGAQGQPQQPQAKKARRRRGRGRGQPRQTSPKSSEDLVRAGPRERPRALTAPPDGQTLEGIIGELQSVWGVPQYPQEYRITIKVAEEKDQRADQASDDGARGAESRADGDGPRREKAPAAPLMRMRGQSDQPAEGAPRKRRRGRRRRRGGGGGGGSGGASAPSNS